MSGGPVYSGRKRKEAEPQESLNGNNSSNKDFPEGVRPFPPKDAEDYSPRLASEDAWDKLEKGGLDLGATQIPFFYFFSVVENAGEAVVLVDKKGRDVLYANPSFFKLLGYSSLEEINQQGGVPSLFISKEKADNVYHHMKQGIFWQGEVEWRAKGGSELPFVLRGGAVKSETGEVVGLFGICTDISAHKEMARSLRESEQRLSDIINFIPDALLAIDSQGRVIAWNRAIEEMTGVKAEEMLGKGDYEYALPFYGKRRPIIVDLALSEEIPQEIQKEYVFLKKNHYAVVGETKTPRVRGQNRFLWAKAAPLLDTQGNIIGAVETIRDITEWKKAEEELRASCLRLAAMLEGIVQALSAATEKRDPYTAGHQQRVSRIACGIAEKMGLSRDQIEGIRIAALLHDIGKLYIAAEILTKPGKLNDIEFMLVKTHPHAGYEILCPIPFEQPVAQIILQHHERENGSGYPQGLKGPEILVEAKILAVADVVEAMSSHRPYRPAYTLEEACAEIRRHQGILYDPEVVSACLSFLGHA